MAAKASWYWNYVTFTLCVIIFGTLSLRGYEWTGGLTGRNVKSGLSSAGRQAINRDVTPCHAESHVKHEQLTHTQTDSRDMSRPRWTIRYAQRRTWVNFSQPNSSHVYQQPTSISIPLCCIISERYGMTLGKLHYTQGGAGNSGTYLLCINIMFNLGFIRITIRVKVYRKRRLAVGCSFAILIILGPTLLLRFVLDLLYNLFYSWHDFDCNIARRAVRRR